MNENFKTDEKIKAWVAELEKFFDRKFGEAKLQIVERTLFGNVIEMVPSMAGKKWEIYYYEKGDNPLFLMMDKHLVRSYHGCWENLKKIAEDIVLEKIVENMRIFFKNPNLGFSCDYNTYSFAQGFNLTISRTAANKYVLRVDDSHRDLAHFEIRNKNIEFPTDADRETFIRVGEIIVKRQEAVDNANKDARDKLCNFLA